MGETARRSLRRALRYLARLGAAVGILSLLIASAAVGLVLHLDMPAGRRVTARLLSEFLSSTFRGTLTVGKVERVTSRGITARDIVVQDEYGNTVLKVDQLRGRADLVEIMDDLLMSDAPKVTIVIRHARVENAESYIIPDPRTGEPTIAGAFTLRRVKAPAEPAAEPGRQIRVWLPVIEVGKGFARGKFEGGPTLETSITGARGSVLTTSRGVAVDVQRFGMVARGVGGTDAVGTGELHVRAPGAVWGAFDGSLGELPLSAFIRVDGKRLSITADIPRVRPNEGRALLADWPLREDVTAHMEASGELPILETSGRFEIGSARVSARGPLRLAGGFALDLDARGESVDLRAVLPDAPKTSIDVESAVSIYAQRGRIVVDVNGTTQATTIEGVDIPPIDVTGSLDRGIFDGKATVHERGMPLKVGFTIQPDGVVHLDALARRFRIENAPRVASFTRARGTVEARVQARIEKGKVDAHVDGDVWGFSLDDTRLTQGHVNGHVTGPLTKPRLYTVSGQLTGKKGSAGGFAFEDVRAAARGPVQKPLIHAQLRDENGPSVEASGYLDTTRQPKIEGLEVAVSRDGAVLRSRVERLELGGGNIDIEDLSMVGAGQLRGHIHIRPKLLEAKIEGEDLDLDAISRVLGLPPGMFGGKLRINANVSAGSDIQRGTVFLALGKGSIASLGGISMRMKASLDDERFDGELSAQVRDVGAVGATWETKLPGHVLEPTSWRDVIGSVRLNLSRLELANLVALLPPEARISAISGTGFADIELNRRVPAALPNVIVRHAGTERLQIERAPPDDNPDAEPEIFEGFDLRLSGELSGETGESTGTTLLFYNDDLLGSASGTARLDLARFVKAPGELDAQLLETPLDAALVLNRHDVAALPPAIRPAFLYGQVGARLLVRGTARAPAFQLSAEGNNLTMSAGRDVVPVDVKLDAQYEKNSGAFGVGAQVIHRGNVVAVADARGETRWQALFGETDPNTPRWTGGGRLNLRGLPLGVIAPLAGKRITGELWDTMVIDRRGELLPGIVGNVAVRNLAIDEVPLGTGKFSVKTNGENLTTELSFKNGESSFKAVAKTVVSWDELLPSIRDGRPVQLGLEAQAFDAIVLSPVLSDVFSTLKGRIYAKLDSTLVRSPETKEWAGQLKGTASMSGGLLKLRVLGLELDNVRFQAEAHDEHPYSLVTVTNFRAKARSKKDNLEANGNVRLRGLTVVSASVGAAIDDFPLVIEGVPQATADGAARVVLTREPEEMRVVVRVDQLNAKLPRASERSVIPLESNEFIEVLQPLREPSGGAGGRGLPYRIMFDLGNVRITRHDIQLRVTGDPELTIAERTKLSGEVKLVPGGHMLLLGSKSFTIENGRVRFDTGDSGNPSVDVLASWQSPDGTTIYVRVRGTLKKPEVALESAPPRTEAELMTLLLGGRADDDEASESVDSQNQATGAGVGLGASKLNELFKESFLGKVPIEFRAGQTKDQRTSYIAAYRISDTVWIEGIFRDRQVNTQDEPNTRPDVSTAVDYRFRKNWSLRSEIGTLGAGLELLWQYRY